MTLVMVLYKTKLKSANLGMAGASGTSSQFAAILNLSYCVFHKQDTTFAETTTFTFKKCLHSLLSIYYFTHVKN
jgi:hypothetical protein